MVGGVAGHARLTRAHRDPRVEMLQALHDRTVRVHGHEHVEHAVAGRRDHRRRQRRVPAAGDRQVPPMHRVRAAEALHDLQEHQESEEVAGLVRPGHVSGLVLDPHAPVTGEPELVAQRVRPGKRRADEAVAVDPGDLTVESGDQLAVLLVAHPAGAGQLVGMGEAPVAQVGAGPGGRVNALREVDRRDVEAPSQDVVDVVTRARVRATEGIGIVRARRPAATRAHQRARVGGLRGGHSASSTPVRALNSSIRRSQSPTMARVSVQNVGSLRTRNSSIEMPCCSTQV